MLYSGSLLKWFRPSELGLLNADLSLINWENQEDKESMQQGFLNHFEDHFQLNFRVAVKLRKGYSVNNFCSWLAPAVHWSGKCWVEHATFIHVWLFDNLLNFLSYICSCTIFLALPTAGSTHSTPGISHPTQRMFRMHLCQLRTVNCKACPAMPSLTTQFHSRTPAVCKYFTLTFTVSLV